MILIIIQTSNNRTSKRINDPNIINMIGIDVMIIMRMIKEFRYWLHEGYLYFRYQVFFQLIIVKTRNGLLLIRNIYIIIK
jgi:hypothetical protein